MTTARRKPTAEKQVTRYTYDDIQEPRVPETGQTPLLPDDDLTVTLPMDNGWTEAIQVGHLQNDGDRPVIVDMDPALDPVLFWSAKRSRREIPVLPLQRNEIVAESRIKQIIEHTRHRAASNPREGHQLPFGDLEKQLRETDKDKRVEFYTHDQGWKNKLICGDSLQVMESLIHYEGMAGKVQMIYIDPPYGINYDSNFQQRVDSTQNAPKDKADDVLSIAAFRDTWELGVHSYLSTLQRQLYLAREMLANSGSIFLQIGDDHVHLLRALMDEVFGRGNCISDIAFMKVAGRGSSFLDSVFDHLLWYAREKPQAKFRPVFVARRQSTLDAQYNMIELNDGSMRKLTAAEISGASPTPPGERFMTDNLLSQGESASGDRGFEFNGRTYRPAPGYHWKVKMEGLAGLARCGRLIQVGNWLKYKRFATDFGFIDLNNIWADTIPSTFSQDKLYTVQTPTKVIERCTLMTSDPGDLVFDPTSGSGTTAYAAEKLGRRWVTCDSSRVAANVTRKRLMSASFEHFRTRDSGVSSGFVHKTAERITLRSLAYGLEPEKIELVDQFEPAVNSLRVTGPFEVMTLGRYSIDDWKGYVRESGKLENYIAVICRLYRKDAAVQGAAGLVHAVAESETERLAISVGPLSGRVTPKQINDAVDDALELGIDELHVLGWAFEANVGEEKAALEARTQVHVHLVMIRPDTLAEGLKATQPDMLFSPLALPDVEFLVSPTSDGGEEAMVELKGVGIFDRKLRTTEYRRAGSGYIAAWYLDEDYDGDCFVDSQMFFDFAKAPNLKAALKVDIDPAEYKLQLTSEPFRVGDYHRIAVKVVDVYGNESTVVRDLT